MINLLSATTIFDDMVQFLSTNMGIWYVILFNAFGVLAILTKVSEYQFKKRATRIFKFTNNGSIILSNKIQIVVNIG